MLLAASLPAAPVPRPPAAGGAVSSAVDELRSFAGEQRRPGGGAPPAVHGIGANVARHADVAALADFARDQLGSVDLWIKWVLPGCRQLHTSRARGPARSLPGLTAALACPCTSVAPKPVSPTGQRRRNSHGMPPMLRMLCHPGLQQRGHQRVPGGAPGQPGPGGHCARCGDQRAGRDAV